MERHGFEGWEPQELDATKSQAVLQQAGIPSMPPFTDFDYRKQAFAEGEMWPVADARLEASVRDGLITAEQAEHFRRDGALGSHLEILQRDDGYKGFNQTGVSDIIRRTDPRCLSIALTWNAVFLWPQYQSKRRTD